MAINRDFEELLSAFVAREVRFLVVGGYAFSFHAVPRFTKDLDLWIDPDPVNARRAWESLAAFGAPLKDLSPEDLARPDCVFQIGVAPNRVDILSHLAGLSFPDAWRNRVASNYGGTPVHYIGLDDLITNKRAAGRRRDRDDVRALERRRQRKPPA